MGAAAGVANSSTDGNHVEDRFQQGTQLLVAQRGPNGRDARAFRPSVGLAEYSRTVERG